MPSRDTSRTLSNRSEQAGAECGPGADRLNMAQELPACRCTAAPIITGGGTRLVPSTASRPHDCVRQSRTEPTQSHEGTAHTLMVESGVDRFSASGAPLAFSAVVAAVSAQILEAAESYAGTQAQHLRGGAASQRPHRGHRREAITTEELSRALTSTASRTGARGRMHRGIVTSAAVITSRCAAEDTPRGTPSRSFINTAHEVFDMSPTQQGTHATHALPCTNPGAQTASFAAARTFEWVIRRSA